MNSQKKQSPRCLTSCTNVLHVLIVIRHGDISHPTDNHWTCFHKCNAICLSSWLYQILSGHYSTPPTSLDIIWCKMCNSFFTNILWITIVTNIWLFTRASRAEEKGGDGSEKWEALACEHPNTTEATTALTGISRNPVTTLQLQMIDSLKSQAFHQEMKPLGVGGSPGHRSLWGIQTTILGWLG